MLVAAVVAPVVARGALVHVVAVSAATAVRPLAACVLLDVALALLGARVHPEVAARRRRGRAARKRVALVLRPNGARRAVVRRARRRAGRGGGGANHARSAQATDGARGTVCGRGGAEGEEG